MSPNATFIKKFFFVICLGLLLFGVGKLFIHEAHKILRVEKSSTCTPAQIEAYIFCQDPKVEFGLAFQNLEITERMGDRDISFSGWWIRHSGEIKDQTLVLLAHGAGLDRRAMSKHVSYLNKTYDIVNMDLNGVRNSHEKTLSYGLREAESLLVAKNWAQKQGYENIILFGSDLGGFASLRAAALAPKDFRAVIAESSFASAKEALEAFNAPLFGWLFYAYFSFLHGFPLERLDIRNFGHEVKIPAFIIHALHDPIIPQSQALQILAATKGENELWIVPASTHHKIWNQVKEEYQERILKFVQKALKSQAIHSP